MIAVSKVGPAALPAVTAALATDDVMAVKVAAVIAGLAFGAMWRAGSLASEGQSWGAMIRDMIVSLLIGGANAVLTLALAQWLGVGPLFAMALAVVIGATGVRTLPALRGLLITALHRRLVGDDFDFPQDRDGRL